MPKPERPQTRKTFTGGFLVKACVMLFFFGVWGLETAYAGLTIQPTTWNVVGLDSNNPGVGPNTFPIGVRVCNTGAATVTNVSATYVWDSGNIYISLSGPSTINVPSLAAGACTDFYFSVTILRTAAAYNAARRYHITVTGDSVASVSTPTPREIYVERIISQSRNSINSISGPTTVYVGQTYNYTVNASTATGGYSQLEAFLELPNIIFQIQSISTTYTAPPGATNDKFYADACGWDNNPLSPSYLSCIGPPNYPGGKAGGTVVTTYTVKILTTGTTTASTLVLDYSGSSYHYNNDYGTKTITITALPPPLTLSKIANPTSLATGGTVDYTLRLTNAAPFAMVVDDFVDILPTTPGNAIYTTNTSKFNGVAISNPAISGATLTWTGVFLVPAGTVRDLTFQVVLPNVTGAYTNQAVAHIGLTQIDTTSITSDNVPATAIVTIQPPPLVDLLKSVNPSSPQPPGTDLTYTIAFTNTGGVAATGLIVTDPIPANTDFKVGSVTSNLGTTGLTVVVEYSNNNGSTWTYTPVSGGGGGPAGYDRAVTDVRWSLTGNLSQTAPNNTGSLGFTVRIR
jgi:uncharacterized repeat protein (TIGR01451 family)